MLRPLIFQARALRWVLLAFLVPPAIILLVASAQTVTPMWMLMRDPVSIAELPPYTGLISNLGALLWCAAGSICLFAAAVLQPLHRSKKGGRFLFWGGIVTLLLMADDFFTVYEVLAFYGGFPDTLLTGLYAVLVGVYLIAFRHYIWTTDYVLLALALALLGSSIAVDALNFKDSELLFVLIGDRYHLVEDGPKLMGIAAWLGYFVRVSSVELLSVRRDESVRPPTFE